MAGMLLPLFLLCVGCVTTMTNLTPPHALEAGELQVTGAGEGQLSSVVIRKSLSAAEDTINEALDEGTEITPEEMRNFLDAAAAWSLFTPGVTPEAMVRRGFQSGMLPGMDAGLRMTSSVLKADVKLQLWESESGAWAASAGVGYGWHYDLIGTATQLLTMSKFSRHDLDLIALGGLNVDDELWLYGGPRVILSQTRVEPILSERLQESFSEELAAYDPNQFFYDERLRHYGFTLGLRGGRRWIFINLELTGMISRFEPTILEEKRDFSGVVLAPSAGVTLLRAPRTQ